MTRSGGFIAPRRPSPTAGLGNLPDTSDAAATSVSIIDDPPHVCPPTEPIALPTTVTRGEQETSRKITQRGHR